MQSSIVMKIGGSLLYDDNLQINRKFLLLLANWYTEAKKQYKNIVLVIGGGKISRHITNQLAQITPSVESMHSVGMEATRLNAEIVKAFLADKDIFVPLSLGDAIEQIISNESSIIVSGGHKAGWSTDMDAAVFADILHVETIYKISGVDAIYTSDPAKDPTATPISDLTWQQYMVNFGIVPGVTKHAPGFSTPIGAFATQFCSQKGISVRFSGSNDWSSMQSIDEILAKGTFVHP